MKLLRGKQTDTDITVTGGTRHFTGKVRGVSTLFADHALTLVTKDYVDSTTGAVPTQADKFRNPTASAGNNSPTGLLITFTPASDGDVEVAVNTAGPYKVGDGVKVGVSCYFTGDGGATARLISAIVATDELYWNGVISGFELATDDEVSFIYNV